GAAMGRMGATILAPFFEAAKGAFPGIIAMFDQLSGLIEPLVARLADSPGFARVTDFFARLPELVGPGIDKLRELAPIIAPLGAAFAALGASTVAGALGPLGALVPTVSPLVAAFGGLVAMSPDLQAAFRGVWQALAPLV